MCECKAHCKCPPNAKRDQSPRHAVRRRPIASVTQQRTKTYANVARLQIVLQASKAHADHIHILRCGAQRSLIMGWWDTEVGRVLGTWFTTIEERNEERLKVKQGASSLYGNVAALQLPHSQKELAPDQLCTGGWVEAFSYQLSHQSRLVCESKAWSTRFTNNWWPAWSDRVVWKFEDALPQNEANGTSTTTAPWSTWRFTHLALLRKFAVQVFDG